MVREARIEVRTEGRGAWLRRHHFRNDARGRGVFVWIGNRRVNVRISTTVNSTIVLFVEVAKLIFFLARTSRLYR